MASPPKIARPTAAAARARLAIAEADVIVLVVDAMAGPTAADLEAAELLRLARAPVIVAPNKADNERREQDAVEFYALGWPDTYPISAAHGRGVADLLDALVEVLPPESPEERARTDRQQEADEIVVELAEADEAGEDLEAWEPYIEEAQGPVSISIVGRPNVGKSSLLNALLGEERSIVSPIPGTTRDAVDTRLEWGRGELLLIDTAGIRRRGKVASGPAAERYSTLRALKAVARADVAVLLIHGPGPGKLGCRLWLSQRPSTPLSGGEDADYWKPGDKLKSGIGETTAAASDRWLTYRSRFRRAWPGGLQGYEGVAGVFAF